MRWRGSAPCRDRLRPGTGGLKLAPIDVFDVAGLPPSVDALMRTADFQGGGGTKADARLRMEALVTMRRTLARDEAIAAPKRTVALLADDFWASPDFRKRRGQSDERDVTRREQGAFLDLAVVFGSRDPMTRPATPDVQQLRRARSASPGTEKRGSGAVRWQYARAPRDKPSGIAHPACHQSQ